MIAKLIDNVEVSISALLYGPRSHWESRAADLRRRPQAGWTVGRTDMVSYADSRLVHYAYPPASVGGERVPFFGNHITALRQAVLHAEGMNAKSKFVPADPDQPPSTNYTEAYGGFPRTRRRRLVTICGSSRFPELHFKAAMQETMQGNIVLLMGLFPGANFPDGSRKCDLSDLKVLHEEKLRMCDEVVVVTRDKYVGESTKRFVTLATKMGKPVRYMNHVRTPEGERTWDGSDVLKMMDLQLHTAAERDISDDLLDQTRTLVRQLYDCSSTTGLARHIECELIKYVALNEQHKQQQ